ncbi:hypothetical protein SAMN05444722_0499 [Rhodovulum sp. ES.010]|uniref:hypothetical protein n=1 Tax=Rhodovulum sp. ES.010 TaxID=1882821 RepID=UPI000925E2EB|nr:hypothetical protein [Rhodovulum sp. ES.010]SIO12080.1 hypothetical protein SAMN05444722_0499 [Rhodovulum sp. ES.010]
MGRAPLFLAREGYRRRRLADMARFLPVLGAALFLVPALDARDGLSAAMLIYLFGAWGGLILASGLLARRLCRSAGTGQAAEAREEGP